VYTIPRDGLSDLHHPWGGSFGSIPSLGRDCRVYAVSEEGLSSIHHPCDFYILLSYDSRIYITACVNEYGGNDRQGKTGVLG
jgi:hypothetical protein